MTDIPIPAGSEPREQLDGAERFGAPTFDQHLVDIGAFEAAGRQGTTGPFSDFVDQVLGKTTNRVGSLGWLFAGVEPTAERELPRFYLTDFPKIPLNQEPEFLNPIRADYTTTTKTSPLPRLIPIDELRKELPPSVLDLLAELREKWQREKHVKNITEHYLLERFGVQKPTPVDEPAQHDVSIEPLPEVGLPKGADGLIDPIALDYNFTPPSDEEFARRTYRLTLEFMRGFDRNMFNNQLYIKGTPKLPFNPSIFVEEYYKNPKLPEPKEYIENNPKPKGVI